MNHRVAALCHFLVAECRGSDYIRISAFPALAEALPRAMELGLIESSKEKSVFGRYVIRLTKKGTEATSESLCVFEEMS